MSGKLQHFANPMPKQDKWANKNGNYLKIYNFGVICGCKTYYI